MTEQEFEKYKETSRQVIKQLIKCKQSSLLDIQIIYNIIMGFPYLLPHYGCIYEGRYYKDVSELTIQGQKDLWSRYGERCRVDFDIPEDKVNEKISPEQI